MFKSVFETDEITGERLKDYEQEFTYFTLQDRKQISQSPQFSSRVLTDTDEQGDIPTQAPSNDNQLGIQWRSAFPRVVINDETLQSTRERWYRLQQNGNPRGPVGCQRSYSVMDEIDF